MGNQFYRLEKEEIPAVEKEVLRYAGFRSADGIDESFHKLAEKCISEMSAVLKPQCVYDEFPLSVNGETISFADVEIHSKALSLNLSGCSKVVIFASTIGAAADVLIRRAQLSGSADSALMQACGAMFVESFTDKFNDFIKEKAAENNMTTKPRFSPGYGDVPLSVQKDFFRLLNCSKIGLTLMNSLIMAPEKSVTAFIGLK